MYKEISYDHHEVVCLRATAGQPFISIKISTKYKILRNWVIRQTRENGVRTSDLGDWVCGRIQGSWDHPSSDHPSSDPRGWGSLAGPKRVGFRVVSGPKGLGFGSFRDRTQEGWVWGPRSNPRGLGGGSVFDPRGLGVGPVS